MAPKQFASVKRQPLRWQADESQFGPTIGCWIQNLLFCTLHHDPTFFKRPISLDRY